MGEQERVNVPEAAARLGTTEGAVRKRIARGTLPVERDQKGRVWVLLDTQADTGTHREAAGQAAGQSGGQDLHTQSLEEQVEYLRDQLRREQDAHAEARRIIAALTSRIPQLEAPQEPQNEPEMTGDEPPRGTPFEQPETAPEECRPWWRRLLGS